MKLQGSIALVTGASRGIGRAIAIRLANEGAKVIGTATTQAGADSVSEALAPFGGEGRVLNVCDAKASVALVDDIYKNVGFLDILVNNAGITKDMIALRLKDEDWAAVIETNLTSVFRLCRAVIRPMMKEQKGRIINIGSVVGSMGNFGQSNYAAAKGGLIAMSKSLAGELGKRNITVNVVAPGFIDTDMTSLLTDDIRRQLLERTLIPRFGEAHEVAAAVAFLASPEAGYITGQTLHVNGGVFTP
jgi:3-oxoacyl-[acyl-carrier protein] reductase